MCVQYFNRQNGLCEGENVGAFDPAIDIATTAQEKCCDVFSAGAYYDIVTESCLACLSGKVSGMLGYSLGPGVSFDLLECLYKLYLFQTRQSVYI